MPMTERLLRHVDAHLGEQLRALGFGEQYETWVSERTFSLDEPFAQVTLRQALDRSVDQAKLPARLTSELEGLASGSTSLSELRSCSDRAAAIDWENLKKGLAACDTDGDRVFVAYEYLAEPFLPEDYRTRGGDRSLPVFIRDYPAETSPLARRKDSDPSLTDRFELFVDGRELCNAFSELNDPEDQEGRFRDQVERKKRGDEETMDYDADYVRALEHGMPPAAGFGLGVDRLAMTLLGQPSIRDVIAFPLLRPETSD